MITPTDRQWMQRAIALARSKGSTPADTPIAAIIVIDGRVLAELAFGRDFGLVDKVIDKRPEDPLAKSA